MGTKTEKLISYLADAISMLQRHGVTHWATWLEKDKNLLEKSDFYGIEHLLSAFGGMGSFNDLYICKENGHSIEDDQVSIVNDKLMELNRKIYELAEEIRKEVNS
jgi:hypothetical protein